MPRPAPPLLRAASWLRLSASRPPLYVYQSCRLTPRGNLRLLAASTSAAPVEQPAKKPIAELPYDPRTPLTIDHRNRLSTFFAPTGGISVADKNEDVHALLVRAGYIRQAYSGIFHLLPLGLRVQDKIEKLIDKHMRAVGASKLALSTISSEALWKQSGRLEKGGQELIRFKDRKNSKFLLSPTHEEEITSLVASLVTSYRQLPLRLYQITRKYRDERRPRAGLLRCREFMMKDLYTFDVDEQTAIATYNSICRQYRSLFQELKIPFIVAEADSGTMGGTISHEYHYPSPTGEDVVISCTSCGYAANEICAKSAPPKPTSKYDPEVAVFHGITKDRKTLINVFYPKLREPAIDTKKPRIQDADKHADPLPHEGSIHFNEVNPHRIKELIHDYDPSVNSPLELFRQHFTEFDPTASHINPPDLDHPPKKHSSIINIYDYRLSFFPDLKTSFANHSQLSAQFFASKDIPTTTIDPSSKPDVPPLNMLKIVEGDLCPRCSNGSLTLTTAIELGHTFHLSTRYSAPLNARASSCSEEDQGKMMLMSMGCHGVGVSRMIAAIAEGYRDSKGLMWPRVIAPFEVCIVGTKGEGMEDVYDIITSEEPDSDRDEPEPGSGVREVRKLDVILDDRGKTLVWKMNDADLIGYPVVLVLGRVWNTERKVEVQCRSKGLYGKGKSLIVEVGELRKVVNELLNDL
ncbi:hypothetical protein BDZ91DRAFT_82889 [Kalaharituber pfeilii]|nr:hypothetical protein BDZ91DRAFT_82889 [Kalaharituber pfeilii]